ncbi:MAG: hypothetical protein QOG76_660, partial [Pseudonocardiales bacterium]|nr:hypothetical protein [Pseudonocardiales bacterium]
MSAGADTDLLALAGTAEELAFARRAVEFL